MSGEGVDTDELRRLTSVATPGPWIFTADDRCDGGEIESAEGYTVSLDGDADAAYIAAADPGTVLALLDELDRLRGERDTLRRLLVDARGWVLDGTVGGADGKGVTNYDEARIAFADQIAAALAGDPS